MPPAPAPACAAATSDAARDENNSSEDEDNDAHDHDQHDVDAGRVSSSDDGSDAGEDPDELSDNEYEIECIIEMRRLPGKPMESLVKWKGYDVDRDAASSWLLRRDFSTQSAYDSLLAFERRRKRDAPHAGEETGGNANEDTVERGQPTTSAPLQPARNAAPAQDNHPFDSSEDDDDFAFLHGRHGPGRGRGRGRGCGQGRNNKRGRYHREL